MPSSRAESVAPFLVMDVLARARELERAGHDVVHFELGEPDFATPVPVKEAGIAALEADLTHYTPARGEHGLVEAIARFYVETHGVQVSPERIVVSSGTSPLLLMTVLAVIDPGDEVVMARPYYPCYPNFVRLAGGVPVFVDVRPEDGFRIDAEAVRAKITPRTKAILVNSPANPTGAVLDEEALRRLGELGPLVISDEIYHGLQYGGEDRSMLRYTGNCIVINGFSKRFAMTGWRLGYVIVPPGYARVMEVLQQNLMIAANSFAQRGGFAALEDSRVREETLRMRSAYDERRQAMLAGLRRVGLGIPVDPLGAFYVLADVRGRTEDTIAFARRILEETHVAVTPGDDFGAPGFLRFSYATGMERIREGLKRLERWFA